MGKLNKMSAINHFIETLRIVSLSNNMTPEEAKEKVRRLKKLNKDKPKNNSRLQTWLDWLAQPTMVGVNMTEEQAAANSVLQKGYWEAIAVRDGKKKEIHQHLHLHGVDDQTMKKAQAYKKLEELEKRRMELLKELEE